MFHSVGGHRVVYRSLNQNDIRSSNQHFNVTTWYELNSAFKKKQKNWRITRTFTLNAYTQRLLSRSLPPFLRYLWWSIVYINRMRKLPLSKNLVYSVWMKFNLNIEESGSFSAKLHARWYSQEYLEVSKRKKCLGVRTQKRQHQAVYQVLKLKWLHYLKILSKERPSWKQLSKANQNTGLVCQDDQREPQLTAVSVSKFVFFFFNFLSKSIQEPSQTR